MESFNYPVVVMSESGSHNSTLSEVIQDKNVVIDFWHTRCVRCPAALEKMNDEAAAHPEVTFIACALSLGDGNDKVVSKMIVNWPNLIHVFLNEETKELVKDRFNILSVPYALSVNKVKRVYFTYWFVL
jgi:thiol-disulfide isomerase/thioredoxin